MIISYYLLYATVITISYYLLYATVIIISYYYMLLSLLINLMMTGSSCLSGPPNFRCS